MKDSTLLMKNNRIRICNTNQLNNLVNHILRNYKKNTKQYKDDFNAEDTKLNVFISPELKLKNNGKNWFAEVEDKAKDFKNSLQQSLIEADGENKNISLSRSDKDKTIKSINYFSKLKNYDVDLESSIIPIIETCEAYKKQDSKNKDYSIFDKQKLNEALDFYNSLSKEKKVKSLNAKKKNLTQILENVDAMKVANQRRATASSRSIGFEETLLKIPKHNNQSVKDKDMINIYYHWHRKHFKDYKVLGGAFHKDERTTKGNAVDDHLHIIKSGFNQSTKRFDLPDYTFKKGLEMAKEQGIDFEYNNEKYNETSEELRLLSGEALQTEFYKFANEILLEKGYDFQFRKKELTPEELILRDKIKEQANKPKAQRDFNLSTFLKEESLKSAQKLLNNEEKLGVTEQAYKDKKERVEELDVILKYKERAVGYLEIDIDELKNNKEKEVKELKEIHKSNKQSLKDYNNSFLSLISVMQRRVIEDFRWSYNDIYEGMKYFKSEKKAITQCKYDFDCDEVEAKTKIKKPIIMVLKEKVEKLWNDLFNDEDDNEDLQENLTMVNDIIKNSIPDLKDEHENVAIKKRNRNNLRY